MATAPATPAIFPVPTVPANAVQTAWNGDIAPSVTSDLSKIFPKILVKASLNFRT